MANNPFALQAPKTLRTSGKSPFGRMARMAAMALNSEVVWEDMDRLDPKDPLPQQNPLRKIPCMILEDGSAIHDSTIIMQYLDAHDGRNILLPAPSPLTFAMLTDATIAKGITAAAFNMVYEIRNHPEDGQPNMEYVDAQRQKIIGSIAYFEENLPTTDANMVSIKLAASLGYVSFRGQHDWEGQSPRLGQWLKEFANKHAFYGETIPTD